MPTRGLHSVLFSLVTPHPATWPRLHNSRFTNALDPATRPGPAPARFEHYKIVMEDQEKS